MNIILCIFQNTDGLLIHSNTVQVLASTVIVTFSYLGRDLDQWLIRKKSVNIWQFVKERKKNIFFNGQGHFGGKEARDEINMPKFYASLNLNCVPIMMTWHHYPF